MKRNLLSKSVLFLCLIFSSALAFSAVNHLNGFVFYDENGDSLYNGSDTGIAGARLLLYHDVNDNDVLDGGDVLLQETYTLLGGEYIFYFPYDDDHKELIVTVDTTSLAGPVIPRGDITRKFTFTYDGMCINGVNFGFDFDDCILHPGNVVHYKKGLPPCEPCEGGLYKMVVRLSDPGITERVKVDIKIGATIAFTDSVDPGGLIIIQYPDSSKLPNDLDFCINGTLKGSIHTSCSQPIGPGVDFGSFEIFRAYSIDTAPVCPPGDGDCGECEGGMKEITFQYNGPLSDPKIKIVGKKNGKLFEDNVDQGEQFTFTGINPGSRMDNEISIYINNNLHTTLHTSCSQPINAGMAVGDLTLVSGQSVKGGYLCTDGDPGGGDCRSCYKEVKSLTLKYIGSESSVKVTIKKGKKKYFHGTVDKNDPFSLTLYGKEDKLPKDLYFYIDYKKVGKYKFDCSMPLSPGFTFGDFEVVSATTKGDKEICDDDDDNSNNGCDECKGGVTYLKFKYDGADAKVKIKITGGSTTYYNDSVSLNESFTIGSKTGSKLEKDLTITINGIFHSKLHTSCSQPIGPGIRAGTLVIEEAWSVDNGEVCPETPISGCTNCTDGLKSVTLRYDGPGTNIDVEVKEGKDKVFDDELSTGDVFTVIADDGKSFDKEIKIKVDGDHNAEFATDCDGLIGAGQVSGDFTIISGIEKDGRVLCDLDVTNCGECEGGLSTLSVRYEGATTKTVKIVGKSITYFNQSVAPGTIITITKGSESRIVNEIDLYINNVKNTDIHTSCSQPIYPGLTAGAFLITEVISNKGGAVCPKEPFCFAPDSTNLNYILGEPDDLGTLLEPGAEIIVDLIDTLLKNKNYTIRAALEGSSPVTSTLDIYESLNGITYSAVKNINVTSTTYTDFTLTTTNKARYIVIQNPGDAACVKVDAISYTCDAVPVEWFTFEGFIVDPTQSKLFWETSLEVDNKEFIVERRFEHEDAFYAVGTVEGAGNSTAINSYEFTDDIRGYRQGNIYYRLKQVDFSGQFDYSEILVLGLLNKDEVVIAPNPAIRATTVVLPAERKHGNYTIEVYSMDGRNVSTQVQQGDHDHMVDLDFGTMTGGFYFVKIKNGESVITKKVLIK